MSCAPEFVQAGGLAAIEQGEAFIAEQRESLRTTRDLSIQRLSTIDGVNCIPPSAAFYAYFQIEGITDNAKFAREMAEQAKVGIAPGITFDPKMQDWFRICFAKSPKLLNEAFDRMEKFLTSR